MTQPNIIREEKIITKFKKMLPEIEQIGLDIHSKLLNPHLAKIDGVEYVGGNPSFVVKKHNIKNKYRINPEYIIDYTKVFFLYLLFNNGRCSYITFKTMGLGGPLELIYYSVHGRHSVYNSMTLTLSDFMKSHPFAKFVQKYDNLYPLFSYSLLTDKERDILGILFAHLPQISENFMVVSNILAGKYVFEDKYLYMFDTSAITPDERDDGAKRYMMGLLYFIIDKGGIISFTTAMDILKGIYILRRGVVFKAGKWDELKYLIDNKILQVVKTPGEVCLKLNENILEIREYCQDEQILDILEEYAALQKYEPAYQQYKGIVYLLKLKNRQKFNRNRDVQEFLDKVGIEECEEVESDEDMWMWDYE